MERNRMNLKRLAGILALAGILITVLAGVASAATGPVTPKGAASQERLDAMIDAPEATTATCRYEVPEGNGIGVVVVTSGLNCSPTASFTINAAPYYGATFYANSGISAFNGYLQQIGQEVTGPVSGGAPGAPFEKLVSVKNVYTNNIETTIYVNPKYDTPANGSAGTNLKTLLTMGGPF